MPLGPWTWTAPLLRYVGHRDPPGSNNSHVLITRQTNATRARAPTAISRTRWAQPAFQPRILRSTRLVYLISRVDPKAVTTVWDRAVIQTSSVCTGCAAMVPAITCASRSGRRQMRCRRGPHADLPGWVVAGFAPPAGAAP